MAICTSEILKALAHLQHSALTWWKESERGNDIHLPDREQLRGGKGSEWRAPRNVSGSEVRCGRCAVSCYGTEQCIVVSQVGQKGAGLFQP